MRSKALAGSLRIQKIVRPFLPGAIRRERPSDSLPPAGYAHGGLPYILTALADEKMEEFAEKKNPQKLGKAEEMKFADALRPTRGRGETDTDVKKVDAQRVLKAMQAKAHGSGGDPAVVGETLPAGPV